MHNKNIANAGWIIGCKLIQAILGVIISMLTARYLGPSNFGLTNYAAAVVAFVAPIAALGLSHILVQEIIYSPECEGKILGTSLVMSFVSSVICILGVLAFSFLTTPGDIEAILVCGLYSLLLLSKALENVQYWFQAKLMSKYTAVVSVIAYILISIYKAILLLTKKSVYWFAVANALDHMMIGIVLLVIYERKSDQRLRFSFSWARHLFSRSKFFILSSMMVTIFAQTDKIMLKFLIDESATGIYSAASACASMTSFVFSAIMDSMRPTIVGYKKEASPLYERSLLMLYSIIIYLALAQNLAMTLLAKPIIRILYGSAYDASIPALRIIVWYTPFSYVGSVRHVWMLAEGKERYIWKLNLAGALTNVVLNMALIPIWGINGAALASVLSQMFTNVGLGFLVKTIRYNNHIMMKSLHPRYLVDIVKIVLRK